ncbi:MAG: NFACT family protein [Lachnospiraceae bacterium]|nr:NFACT family protein [Lachnospiraceae bacterium]
MAFDGITLAAVCAELNEKLSGGRIAKIAQPEKDSLILTVRAAAGQYRLLLSADATLPLVYLCGENKKSPAVAPNFCMLLRKYLGSARITGISQPGLERILKIGFEHFDELGDLKEKTLIIEIMGKHSNIILLDEKDCIVDSIKHVSAMMSSKREVLPGRDWFVAGGNDKKDPLTEDEESFLIADSAAGKDLCGALISQYSGISPAMASELIRLSGAEERKSAAELDTEERKALWKVFSELMGRVKDRRFSPCIYYDKGEVKEFSAINTGMYAEAEPYESISALLEQFYAQKEALVRQRQRSAELRHVVTTALERNVKKLKLQEKQLKDAEDRETLRLYGELLTAYGHGIAPGTKEYKALNYYDNSELSIPLDPELSAMENASRYYDKYQKKKRTFEALSVQVEATREELAHLESVQLSLDLARTPEDLSAIRTELQDCGYIRKKSGTKKEKSRILPLHYMTEDGFSLYVGRNNYQNEEVTFRLANAGDWWFHAKKMAGSHVIVKGDGRELPDRVYEQAAALAAWYSRAAQQEKAEVDYVQRREVKKPAGGAPGYVIYHTNYSMAVKPSLEGLKLCEE